MQDYKTKEQNFIKKFIFSLKAFLIEEKHTDYLVFSIENKKHCRIKQSFLIYYYFKYFCACCAAFLPEQNAYPAQVPGMFGPYVSPVKPLASLPVAYTPLIG